MNKLKIGDPIRIIKTSKELEFSSSYGLNSSLLHKVGIITGVLSTYSKYDYEIKTCDGNQMLVYTVEIELVTHEWDE